MIISRVPLRISLFGGGSDYKSFFSRGYGSVLGGSISKYVYVALSTLPPFAPEFFRLTYRQTESVNSIEDINHPVVKEVFTNLRVNQRFNMATFSDISGGSGLGGSSAFTVALKAALDKHAGIDSKSTDLANYAIMIERDKLKESGGWQDQYHCSVGGFREYRFLNSGVQISEPLLDFQTLEKLSKYFFLYSIGESRSSAEPASATEEASMSTTGKFNLFKLAELSLETSEKIKKTSDFYLLVELIAENLNKAWQLKKNFGALVAPPEIQDEIEHGFANGAIAAKLCGAGQTGYILFMVPEESAFQCRTSLGYDKTLDFTFVSNGAQVWQIKPEDQNWS